MTTLAPQFDAEFLRKLERLEWLTRRRLRGQTRGEQRSRAQGRSIELFDYRAYQHGDDLRYIDWNLYSRLDQLFVKLFAAEEDLTLYLLIDASASMALGQPSKVDYTRRLAAALAYIGLAHFERVGVSTFRAGLIQTSPLMRGRANIMHLLQFLGSLSATGKTSLEMAISDFAASSRKPGMVIVLSDFLDVGDIKHCLSSLRSQRHDAVMLQILAEDDIAPPLAGDLQLVDSEHQSSIRVSLDEALRNTYEQAVLSHVDALARHCLSAGIGYARTSTSVPFEDLVLKHMRTGQLLK
jgi:uncharacterized protein (DUF58 family)